VVPQRSRFRALDRAVHLNTFLMKQGFLVLDDPTKTGDDELLRTWMGQDGGDAVG